MIRSPRYGYRHYPVPVGKAYAYQQPTRVQVWGAEPHLRPAYESGDLIQCFGRWRTFAVVRAPDGHDVRLRIRATRPDNYGYYHEHEPVVPAGATVYVGPFHPDRQYDDLGRVLIQYDDPEGVEIGSVTLPGR